MSADGSLAVRHQRAQPGVAHDLLTPPTRLLALELLAAYSKGVSALGQAGPC
jgi:hypothetical protein